MAPVVWRYCIRLFRSCRWCGTLVGMLTQGAAATAWTALAWRYCLRLVGFGKLARQFQKRGGCKGRARRSCTAGCSAVQRRCLWCAQQYLQLGQRSRGCLHVHGVRSATEYSGGVLSELCVLLHPAVTGNSRSGCDVGCGVVCGCMQRGCRLQVAA